MSIVPVTEIKPVTMREKIANIYWYKKEGMDYMNKKVDFLNTC